MLILTEKVGGMTLNIENELKRISERLDIIERKIDQLSNYSTNERPAWVHFLIAFITVLLAILLISGVMSLLS